MNDEHLEITEELRQLREDYSTLKKELEREKIVNEETGERKVSKAHWLVGKWVVQQMDYTITGDGAVTKLQCIKSNFTMNENSTTIAFPDLCYAV